MGISTDVNDPNGTKIQRYFGHNTARERESQPGLPGGNEVPEDFPDFQLAQRVGKAAPSPLALTYLDLSAVNRGPGHQCSGLIERKPSPNLLPALDPPLVVDRSRDGSGSPVCHSSPQSPDAPSA